MRLRRIVLVALALVLAAALAAQDPTPSPQPAPPPEGGGTASVSTVPLDSGSTELVRSSRRRSSSRRRPARRSSRRRSRSARRRAPAPARTAAPAPPFHGWVQPIDPATQARMSYSWRPGCPVPIHDLRLVTLAHWGFDGRVHRGELVVHAAHADRVLAAMAQLFAARFPIATMVLVDVFAGDDDRSMAANNTSAFNCRFVSGRPGMWSEHAFGWAIDINPVQNPYVSRGRVSPPAGAGFANRSLRHPGMIRPGDAVVRAFASIGWGWGGYWGSAKDYQHFSATGR